MDHLPETKKRELARVVEILFAEFEAAIAGGAMPYKRKGAILKVDPIRLPRPRRLGGRSHRRIRQRGIVSPTIHDRLTGAWLPKAKAKSTNPFRYFDSSPEVIRLVVLMYVRYPLSLRNVEDLLFERSIDICHETVRLWWNRFGPMFAAEIRRKRVRHMRQFTHWRWHLDEVFVRINGEMRYLWRAVDHEGDVLESYVTTTGDKAAALKFIKKAMKRHGRPQAIVTDKLRSYSAAMKEIGNAERQETSRRLNNRAENSHLPFRRRERAMARFHRMKTLRKFTSVHASFHNHFSQERHLVSREIYRERRFAALAEWRSIMA